MTRNGKPEALLTPMQEDDRLDTARRGFNRAVDQAQKILHDKVVFAPIWENGFIRGVGPRVEEPGLSLIPAFPYSAPLEDLRLKK